ncbi:hypothetical protein ACQ4PT_004129 [Festuca glaucescens]
MDRENVEDEGGAQCKDRNDLGMVGGAPEVRQTVAIVAASTSQAALAPLLPCGGRQRADYISGYGVPDRRGRRFTEWRNVFKLLGSAFLNWTRGSSFTGPLGSVWCLQIMRSAYRFRSHNLASLSVWHGGSSELVAEHMRAMYDRLKDASKKKENLKGASKEKENLKEELKPVAMKDYSYLVYGETKQGFKLKKPSGKDGKDIPLAFALSRLLRCRLENVSLQRCIFGINRELIKNIIGGKIGTSDALRIMELQLAFVHDYFNTRYPMVFWCGLPSLFFSLVPSVLTIGALSFLDVDIRKVYKPPNGELANLVKGFNVDMIITWVFISLMIVKEIWEILTYLLSDWTTLIMGCEYVQRKCKRTKESIDSWVDCVLLYFSRTKISGRRWHGFIDQYVFVQSDDDRPRFWNLIHNLTTGIIPKKDDGAKLSSAIKVPDYVREAVLGKLTKMMEEEQGLQSAQSLKKRLQSAQGHQGIVQQQP